MLCHRYHHHLPLRIIAEKHFLMIHQNNVYSVQCTVYEIAVKWLDEHLKNKMKTNCEIQALNRFDFVYRNNRNFIIITLTRNIII